MTDTAVTPSPVTVGAIPWYKSPQYVTAMLVVMGAVTTLYPKASAVLHIDTPTGEAAAIELIGALVTLLGGSVSWVLRQINKTQPITLTQAEATAHPATQALIQTQSAMREAGIPTSVELQATIAASPSVNPQTEHAK
jgi:hypothetical protein